MNTLNNLLEILYDGFVRFGILIVVNRGSPTGFDISSMLE